MLLAARIDPGGMISFFEQLSKEGRSSPALLKYLSTHPSTEERIRKLEVLARQSPFGPVKLLPDYEWGDIRNMCSPSRR